MPATSQVEYGTSSGSYPSSTVLDDTLVTNHAITLTGLTASTTYYYRVKSQSAMQSESRSGESHFTTLSSSGIQIQYIAGASNWTLQDTTAPVIGSIASSSTPFDATITFTTNESAIGFVNYGTDTTYGTSVSDATLATNHSIVVRGLVIGTPYHFMLQAIDRSGNMSSSTDRTFTTQYLTEATLSASSTFINAYQFQQEIESSIASALPSLVPPFLETPTVTTIRDTSAVVTWKTNINSYSGVYYAADTDYDPTKTNPYQGQASDLTTKSMNHSVTLNNLQPNTTYHIMAESFSIAGVFGKSTDVTFTTKPPNTTVPIITNAQVIDIGDTTAAITWKTNIRSYSAVYYATEENFAPTKSKPYSGQTSDITNKVLDHSLALGNLQPGMTYHVMAESFTSPGTFATSSDMTFTTNAAGIIATVSNVSTTAFRIAWTTNIPTNSIVQIKDQKSGTTQTVLDNAQVTFHNIGIDNLTPAQTYRVTASGYTANGNLIKTENEPTVTTKADTAMPVISNIKIQTIIDPQRPEVAQAIVDWKTDKPANTIVSYTQGVASSSKKFGNTIQDLTTYISEHVVIIPNLIPGALYQVQIASIDKSGNKTTYPVQTIIVSQQSQSILDVILNNFENTFQFLQNVK